MGDRDPDPQLVKLVLDPAEHFAPHGKHLVRLGSDDELDAKGRVAQVVHTEHLGFPDRKRPEFGVPAELGGDVHEHLHHLVHILLVGDATGTVERMSMRMTQLRDLEGRAHFIPNGQIRQVTNRTHAWSQAVFNVGVAYQENVDQVMGVLMDVATEFCQDPEFGPFTVGEPQMLGVDELGDAAFRIKFIIRTKADKMFPVRREMLRRIKNKFDELGIRIPIPHRVVIQPQENAEGNQK